MRYIARRFLPRFSRRWLIGLGVVGLLVVAATFVRWGSAGAELELLVLGPDGQFHDSITMPAAWGDTAATTPGAPARFPLTLGVRNAGYGVGQAARLILSVPVRYQLVGPGGEALEGRLDLASPLVRYELDPRLGAVQPRRLPVLLPAFEPLWIEPVIPRYYCVELADSIPDFVPAPPAPLGSLSEVTMLYSIEDTVRDERWTGTITLQLDTTLLAVSMPERPPTFPMEVNPELAQPDLGRLRQASSRTVRCGEPEAPMELVSTVWEAETGARLITLEYGGAVRKHLYDFDGDGIIDRESWDPDGRGRLVATRQARLPIPEFLLPPAAGIRYDMARFDDIPPDSLARLDVFGQAMPGPGPLPIRRPGAPEPLAGPPAPGAPGAPGAPAAEAEPPVRRPAQPLGRPLPD